MYSFKSRGKPTLENSTEGVSQEPVNIKKGGFVKSWETAVVIVAVFAALAYTIKKIWNFYLGKGGCSCETSSAGKNCDCCSAKK
jgi:hypothetical protein